MNNQQYVGKLVTVRSRVATSGEKPSRYLILDTAGHGLIGLALAEDGSVSHPLCSTYIAMSGSTANEVLGSEEAGGLLLHLEQKLLDSFDAADEWTAHDRHIGILLHLVQEILFGHVGDDIVEEYEEDEEDEEADEDNDEDTLLDPEEHNDDGAYALEGNLSVRIKNLTLNVYMSSGRPGDGEGQP